MALLAIIKGRQNEDDPDDENRRKLKIKAAVIAITVLVAAVVLLTSNFTAQTVVFNLVSLLVGPLAGVQLILQKSLKTKNDETDFDD